MSTVPYPAPVFGLPFDPGDISRYVIELDDGMFSTAYTTKDDVDAIFQIYVPRFIESQNGGPARVLFWAHGGLVNRDNALAKATSQIPWWLANGIYPVYFVWDSGVVPVIHDIIENIFSGAVGDLPEVSGVRFSLADPWNSAIEKVVAESAVPGIWEQMKDNIELSFSMTPKDGAGYVAAQVRNLVKNVPDVKLNAVGHSAGAIFHSFFVRAVTDPNDEAGASGTFDTVSLLAPAIRDDDFRARLEPEINNGIRSMPMFTMTEKLELTDNCAGLYRHSLLYLIRNALEPGQPPLLGLQESVDADPDLKALFQTAESSTGAQLILAVSNQTPRSSSGATHHGDFSSDPRTMDSIACRVLDSDSIIPFDTAVNAGFLTTTAAASASPVDPWTDQAGA